MSTVAFTTPDTDLTAGVVETRTLGGDARADFRLDAHVIADVFDALPDAILVVDAAGRVVAQNGAADALLGPVHEHARLCGSDVLSAGATEVSLGTRRVEVSVAPLRAAAGAVLVCRESTQPPTVAPPLRITTLGSVRLEHGGAELGGEWLDHRPGRLLKYLICARGRRVPVEELVDALWPDTGGQGLTSLRQAVHGLRDRLEPRRQKGAPSRFILARANAYELNMASVVVDADDFEREAACALRAAALGAGAEASAQLGHAAQLYRGDFLPDDPYADWALSERDRLRDVAARVLRALTERHLETGELPSATHALQRLADLDPLDVDAQRDLIAVLIRRRRHGEAARRYEQFRRRFERAFGLAPDFALCDLVAHGCTSG